jgi:hypothetical protein
VRPLDGEFSAAVGALQRALTDAARAHRGVAGFSDEELPFDAAPDALRR